MRLAQVPVADGTVATLQQVLRHHTVLPAPGSPMVLFGDDRTPGRYLTANYRGQANNKWNRMVKHGLVPSIAVLTSRDEIDAVLPRVIQVATVRQEALTGTRKLDRPHETAFFMDVVRRHAERGEVEVMVLRIGGDVGAYAVTFLDDRVARMWSSHYDPRWSAYSPGHVICRALVERCVGSPRVDALDWMKGHEDYKFRTANHVEPAQAVRAWSGTAGRVAGEASLRVRDALIGVRNRYPALRQLQLEVRRRLAGRAQPMIAGSVARAGVPE